MESDNVENSMTRLTTMGPQAPPDVSAYRQSYGKKAITNGVPTAVVYCEGNFGQVDGKTANGLVRHSQAYRILAVIDGLLEGRDSGQVLDKVSNGIPILEDLEAAVTREAYIPDTLIYGMAPSTGKMSPADRGVVLDAIALGMNIVSGLHEFLGDDPEISGAADASNVTIRDIRKPRPSKDMRLFDGSVSKVKAIRIAVLGTDCA
ncbi:MAG: DUF1611 domain-containing protein, partial [Pseudomonadota bacterium]